MERKTTHKLLPVSRPCFWLGWMLTFWAFGLHTHTVHADIALLFHAHPQHPPPPGSWFCLGGDDDDGEGDRVFRGYPHLYYGGGTYYRREKRSRSQSSSREEEGREHTDCILTQAGERKIMLGQEL